MAQESAPKPLSPGEVNDLTGKLNWPEALQDDMFAANRKKLEALFVSSSQLGSMNYADQSKVRTIINDMNTTLKSQVRTIPATVYVTCKKFLEGLMFTACKCHLG